MENLSELHAADINRLEAHHQTLLDLCLQPEEAAEDVQTPAPPQGLYHHLPMPFPGFWMKRTNWKKQFAVSRFSPAERLLFRR